MSFYVVANIFSVSLEMAWAAKMAVNSTFSWAV